jgi:hypothetical protein
MRMRMLMRVRVRVRLRLRMRGRGMRRRICDVILFKLMYLNYYFFHRNIFELFSIIFFFDQKVIAKSYHTKMYI